MKLTIVPFGGDGKPFTYIPRRSICDSCIVENCSDRNEKSECDRFTPTLFIFVKCEYCNKVFEIHEAYKSDRLTICPECQKRIDDERYGSKRKAVF